MGAHPSRETCANGENLEVHRPRVRRVRTTVLEALYFACSRRRGELSFELSSWIFLMPAKQDSLTFFVLSNNVFSLTGFRIDKGGFDVIGNRFVDNGKG